MLKHALKKSQLKNHCHHFLKLKLSVHNFMIQARGY